MDSEPFEGFSASLKSNNGTDRPKHHQHQPAITRAFLFPESNKMSDEIDVSTFFITDEPYEENSRYYGSKYDAIFAKLKHNQRLAVPEGTAARVGQGLRKWLEKMGHHRPIVRSKEVCKDGMGGVWWLEGQRPVKKADAFDIVRKK